MCGLCCFLNLLGYAQEANQIIEQSYSQTESEFNLENHNKECFVGHLSTDSMGCLINIPKNASTFLRSWIFYNRKPTFRWFSEIDTRDYQYFICVRNPMYRPISAYDEILKLRPDGFPRITRETEFYKQRQNVCGSFRLFLDEVDGNFYDSHLCYQCERLSKKSLNLADVSFVFLFEKLSKDIKIFSSQYGIDIKNKPKRMMPFHKKSQLKRFIDANPDIQEKIRKIWAKDFEFYEAAKKRREEILASF